MRGHRKLRAKKTSRQDMIRRSQKRIKTTSSKNNSPPHINNREGEVVFTPCETLAFGFPASSNLVIPGKLYICYRCDGATFATRFEIFEHDMYYHPQCPGETTCPLCPDINPVTWEAKYTWTLAINFKEHFLCEHPEADPTESRAYEAFRIMYGDIIKWQQTKIFEPYDALFLAYMNDHPTKPEYNLPSYLPSVLVALDSTNAPLTEINQPDNSINSSGQGNFDIPRSEAFKPRKYPPNNSRYFEQSAPYDAPETVHPISTFRKNSVVTSKIISEAPENTQELMQHVILNTMHGTLSIGKRTTLKEVEAVKVPQEKTRQKEIPYLETYGILRHPYIDIPCYDESGEGEGNEDSH